MSPSNNFWMFRTGYGSIWLGNWSLCLAIHPAWNHCGIFARYSNCCARCRLQRSHLCSYTLSSTSYIMTKGCQDEVTETGLKHAPATIPRVVIGEDMAYCFIGVDSDSCRALNLLSRLLYLLNAKLLYLLKATQLKLRVTYIDRAFWQGYRSLLNS